MGETNKTPEFLAKFPLGKVPALETPQGPIYESNAIMAYVANMNGAVNLYGDNLYEKALCEQWINFCTCEIEPAVIALLLPHYNITTFNEETYAGAKANVFKAFAVLDAHLKKNTFMLGSKISVADFAVFCSIKFLYSHILNSVVQAEYPSVKRFFVTIANQPNVLKVCGASAIATDEKAAPGQKVVKPKVVVAAKVVEEK